MTFYDAQGIYADRDTNYDIHYFYCYDWDFYSYRKSSDKNERKSIERRFCETYNAVLLNAIGSSNVEGQWAKNQLVIYDGK